MSRRAFQNLLERYLKGSCTQEEEETVRRWYDLLDNDEDINVSEVEFDELETRLWDKINEKTLPKDDKKKGLKKFSISKKTYLSIAASVVFLFVSTLWVNQRLEANRVDPDFIREHIQELVVLYNPNEKPLEIVLPDSSRIRLFKGAKVTYPTTFAKREVSLVGDAFFRVTANPVNPFTVFHEGMITKVLGTCFRITAGKETGKDEVIVYSGKVQVIRARKKNIVERIMERPVAVNLGMNQRAVLDEKENTFRETLVEKPIPLETKRLFLTEARFREISLAELATKLAEIYNIQIKVKPTVKKTTFTGDLTDMDLFNQLDVICNVTETTYQIEGKAIIIQ